MWEWNAVKLSGQAEMALRVSVKLTNQCERVLQTKIRAKKSVTKQKEKSTSSERRADHHFKKTP